MSSGLRKDIEIYSATSSITAAWLMETGWFIGYRITVI